MRGEKGGVHALALPGSGRGLGRWARLRGTCMNGPSKSAPLPFGDAASFCCFIFWCLGERSARLLRFFATGRPRSSAVVGSHRRRFLHRLLHRASVVYVDVDLIYVSLRGSTSMTSQPELALAADRPFSELTMAHLADALRPDKFSGMHFKRWQVKVTLWLNAMGVFWASNGKPKDAKELWDTLNAKFGTSDAGSELYVMENFHDYKMADNRSVVEQAHEIQCIVKELELLGCHT
ncbi:hypothetical protein U9M48_005536 [Paspalum notatum var. saurae]|uniref:Uncharacterized protein n=1 Tax=Paspalum notatum var. saurae TaxID=547442 RepID=A0AAQ3SFJ2_PASNO